MEKRSDVQAGYDLIADEYVRRIYHELADKPLDRELLDRFAERVRASGPVFEVGCGPGHVARYLHDRGVVISGLDLSPRMIERARELSPAVTFLQGDMASLPVSDGTLAGIVGFYSIIHIARDRIAAVLRELRRALRPEGLLFLAFHIGKDVTHVDELWGHKIAVDFFFFDSEEMKVYLLEAGFEIEEALEREPYPGVEHPSRRAYILARVPPASGLPQAGGDPAVAAASGGGGGQ